jgi:hypothetical protein
MSAEELGRLAHWLAGVVCGAFVLFAIGLALVVATQPEIIYGLTPLAVVVLALGVMGSVLSAPVAVCAMLAWREHVWSRAGRIFYTLVALAAVVFVGELFFWNLLGVHI